MAGRRKNDDSYDETTDGVPDGSDGGSAEIGLEERLTEILVEESDGDLVVHGGERVVRWLQALDLQLVGACRSDERLKPLLKFNASNGVAEDRLLAHLSQHFEAVEVGLLARCLCIPLVSIRVGKVNKEGTLLCPTSTRGNLNLMVLPTSDLRLSFAGDDGHTEGLFTLSIKSPSFSVTVDGISADNSGRSFLIKIPDGETFYFWCSEKSKLLGIELLAKMKDFLVRRPSIAELTGISESRLGCFATHLRAYLVGSTVVGAPTSLTVTLAHQESSSDQSETPQDGQISFSSTKSLRSRNPGNQAARANSSFQGSLSPRSSSFKEGASRNLTCLKTAARDKLRRRGDTQLVVVERLSVAPSAAAGRWESDESFSLPTSSVSDSVGAASECRFPFTGGLTLQFSGGPTLVPSSLIVAPLLPPLSSLLPTTQTTAFSRVDLPSLDFPAFLPEPLVRSAQQIPTFCDPIVHIPVIDVCSSGPVYLVSAGPTLSTETDSLVEKGARETLRLLISGSSQTKPTRMMDDETAGSRGLYGGPRDVDVIATSFAAIGLVSLSERSSVEARGLRCTVADEDESHPSNDDQGTILDSD